MSARSDFNKYTGSMIRKKREEAGLTVDELAEKLKASGARISANTLRKYEDGEKEIPAALLFQVAEIVHCEYYELMMLTEEERKREQEAVRKHREKEEAMKKLIKLLEEHPDPQDRFDIFEYIDHATSIKSKRGLYLFYKRTLEAAEQAKQAGEIDEKGAAQIEKCREILLDMEKSLMN